MDYIEELMKEFNLSREDATSFVRDMELEAAQRESELLSKEDWMEEIYTQFKRDIEYYDNYINYRGFIKNDC